jgi:hypothetical protein
MTVGRENGIENCRSVREEDLGQKKRTSRAIESGESRSEL